MALFRNSLFTRRLMWLAAVLLTLALGGAAYAQTSTPAPAPLNSEQVVVVRGTGSAFGAPDIAFLVLGAETSDPDVAVALNSNTAAVEAILAALSELGIARGDLQTQNLNLYVSDQYGPMGEPTGQRVYRVSNEVRVTVRDVDQVAAVIQAAVEAGANNVYGVQFGIADQAALRADARAAAVEDARARADALAGLLALELGAPVRVEEIAYGGVQPFSGGFGGGMMQADVAAPPIEQGQLSVTVEVEVRYAIVAAS